MLYFVHGLGFDEREWDRVAAFFSERGHTCRAVNLRDGLDLRHARLQDYVDVVTGMVSDEDIVIGHSMGGLIVQKVAELSNIRAGVGICPAPPSGIQFNSPVRIRDILPAVKYLPRILLKQPVKPDYALARTLCSKYMCVGLPESVIRDIHGQMVEESSIVMRELAMRKTTIDEKMVTCPLVFIAMTQDRAIPPEAVKRIAEKYPTASYICYEGCHHFFNNTNWREVAAGIDDFIAGL
ncbi:MAG: alpha/beta hydrolase [Candidatus Thermoplasmatota archaeon]|nr:alpha/beta hydrolase [Candidatus Thermoplasmatota archaeon]